jgi:hypothetical protein
MIQPYELSRLSLFLWPLLAAFLFVLVSDRFQEKTKNIDFFLENPLWARFTVVVLFVAWFFWSLNEGAWTDLKLAPPVYFRF